MIRIAFLEHEEPTKETVFYLAGLFKKADWTFRHYYKASDLARALNEESYDLFVFDEMFKTPRMESVFVHDHPEAMVIYLCKNPEAYEQENNPARIFFLDQSRIKEELDNIKAELIKIPAQKEIFSMQIQGVKLELPFSDIYYLEKIEKNVYFHTRKGVFHRRENLAALEEIFEPHGFIRTHVSFLVNRKYIMQVAKDEVILAHQQRIPLSRAQKKKLGLQIRSRT